MSAAGPARPSTCSGAMNPARADPHARLGDGGRVQRLGDPEVDDLRAVPVMITLEGFRSLCTIPAAWIMVSASARPAARPYSMSALSGPRSSTYSASVGPSAYSVTMNGLDDSVSASITRTVHTPLIRVSEDTSPLNRLRNCGSSASSGRSTFTATRLPSSATPRYTTPMPPSPAWRSAGSVRSGQDHLPEEMSEPKKSLPPSQWSRLEDRRTTLF